MSEGEPFEAQSDTLNAVSYRRRRLRRGAFVLLALSILAAVGWRYAATSSSAQKYRAEPVRRGDLEIDIGATGTLQPEEVIDVGAQVAGQIVSLGKDTAGKVVDYGSAVDEGTVLARIDDSLYQSDVAEAEAQVKRAKADLTQLQAKLLQAERDWKRAQKLGPSDALSQSAYDAYQAGVEAARANVTVGEAAIVQAEASLVRAHRNLGYTVISSPVQGVIIDRRVNIGQTVVASLNAPSLFLIAKDLKRMEVWVSVNEADIGKISPGQNVSFTVDAFPNQTFAGKVQKIRLNASMTQNVVTYIVEVSADNTSGVLLPYLTANVKFEVSRQQNVLLVPNAALRFTPAGRGDERDGGKGARAGEKPAGSAKPGDDRDGTVWVLEGGDIHPVKVTKAETDGVSTHIESATLKENDLVVVGEERSEGDSSSSGTNPFAPQMPRNRRRP